MFRGYVSGYVSGCVSGYVSVYVSRGLGHTLVDAGCASHGPGWRVWF